MKKLNSAESDWWQHESLCPLMRSLRRGKLRVYHDEFIQLENFDEFWEIMKWEFNPFLGIQPVFEKSF